MNVVITGASSGIGEALAIECAKRGDRLFLCGRNAQRLENTAEKCRALGAATDAETIDVTDSEAVAQWLTQCENKAPIERVFANAGVSTGEETSDNVRRTFATNVGGVVNTVLPAIEIFRNGQERTTRQIVITSSIAGYGPLKACPSYSATKSCVKTWGLALRGMLAPEGIAVSVICPGFIRSRITDANTCPMPFFMEADKAASIILKRADKNKGMISFPWPMRLSTWFLSIMPQFLNELINKLLPKKII
jgi:short-subunit dehydrogenase